MGTDVTLILKMAHAKLDEDGDWWLYDSDGNAELLCLCEADLELMLHKMNGGKHTTTKLAIDKVATTCEHCKKEFFFYLEYLDKHP